MFAFGVICVVLSHTTALASFLEKNAAVRFIAAGWDGAGEGAGLGIGAGAGT